MKAKKRKNMSRSEKEIKFKANALKIVKNFIRHLLPNKKCAISSFFYLNNFNFIIFQRIKILKLKYHECEKKKLQNYNHEI